MANIIGVYSDASTNKDLMKTLIRKVWNSTDGKEFMEYKEVVKDRRDSDEFVRDYRVGGLGLASEIKDGENVILDSPKIGGIKETAMKSFASGFRVTDRFKRFEKWQLVPGWTKNLKKRMLETKDIEIARLFNSATATTYATGFDGFQLGYASHTCLDASATTYDNLLSASLSHSAFESAMFYFDYLYDDNALIMYVPFDQLKLVVNYQLRNTAHEIFGSDKKAHEFSNTKNVLPDTPIFVYHRLTSTTSWFVIAPKHKDYDLWASTAMEPDIKIYNELDTTRDMVVTSYQYFSYGFGDPRLAYIGNT